MFDGHNSHFSEPLFHASWQLLSLLRLHIGKAIFAVTKAGNVSPHALAAALAQPGSLGTAGQPDGSGSSAGARSSADCKPAVSQPRWPVAPSGPWQNASTSLEATHFLTQLFVMKISSLLCSLPLQPGGCRGPLCSGSVTWALLCYQTYGFGTRRQQLANENHAVADNVLLKVGKYGTQDTKYHEPLTEGKAGKLNRRQKHGSVLQSQEIRTFFQNSRL